MARIVVGVDRSDGSAHALRWAAREAALRRTVLTAVLAWGYPDQYRGRDHFSPRRDEDDARAALDDAVESALGAGAPAVVDRRVVCDFATPALLEASAGADLLVVGSRGAGGFRELLLGSVSQQCLHHARTPIAIVRPVPAHEGPERIVVGIDGSETASHALGWALDEGRARQARVRVVHTWSRPLADGHPLALMTVDAEALAETARDTVTCAVAGADTAGLPAPVELLLSEGRAAAAILDAATSADLVVVGSRGLGGFAGLLLGSVSHQVAHHAPCPVVVLRV